MYKQARIVSSLASHENHMKTTLRVLSCSDMRDKNFVLKIYLENHKLRVDGNSSACASMHQQYVKIVTEAIEKENK